MLPTQGKSAFSPVPTEVPSTAQNPPAQSSLTKPAPSSPSLSSPQQKGGILSTRVTQPQYKKDTSLLSDRYMGSNLTHSQPIKDTPLLQRLIDDYFNINHSPFSQHQLEKVICLFGELIQPKDRQTQMMKTLQKKDKIDRQMEIDFLKMEEEPRRVNIKLFFLGVIRLFLKDFPWGSVRGAIKLINFYLTLNEKHYLVDGKFNFQYLMKNVDQQRHLQSDPYPIRIAYQLGLIKDQYFLQYQRIFQALQTDRNSSLGKIFQKKQNTIRICQTLWNNLRQVLQADKQAGFYAFQINILIRGLSLCWQVVPQWFTSQQVIHQIIPQLQRSMGMLTACQKIDIVRIDRFVLNLMLFNRPLMHTTWPNQIVHKLKASLNRYSYLFWLLPGRQIMLQSLPLNQNTLLFIDRLLSSLQQSPDNIQMVDEVICQLFTRRPQLFWKRIQHCKEIIRHINRVQSALNQAQNSQERLEQTGRLSRLLSVIAFPVIQGQVRAQNIKQLLLNTRSITTLFESIFMVISQRKQLQIQIMRCQAYLQSIYQLVFKFIISNPGYFTSYSNLISTYFPSIQQFYCKLFTNYLTCCSNSIQSARCFQALNSVISIQSHPPIMYAISLLAQQQIYLQSNKTQQHLQYIVDILFQTPTNLVPLAVHLLTFIKTDQNCLKDPWVFRLGKKFREVSVSYHVENMTQYAKVLMYCLNFIRDNPSLLPNVTQLFSFGFVKKFLAHWLSLTLNRQKGRKYNQTVLNRYMRNMMYQQLSIAIDLLLVMTQLYLQERRQNDGQLVPHQIRRILQGQGENGMLQIEGKRHTCTLTDALLVLLLSRQFITDHTLRQKHPQLQNRIYSVLINHSKITTLNRFTQTNRTPSNLNQIARQLQQKMQDMIRRHPSYLGLQYLLTRGGLKGEVKNQLFRNIQQIRGDNSVEMLRLKSHFLSVFWKELLPNQVQKLWPFISRQMQLIQKGLQGYLQQQTRQIQGVVESIYQLILLLKDKHKNHYYTQFLKKHHKILLSTQLNKSLIHKHITKHSPKPHIYLQALMTFFNCKCFITTQQFNSIAREDVNVSLYGCVRQFLRIGLDKKQHKEDNQRLLMVVQHGIAMMMELADSRKGENSLQLKQQLEEIRQAFVQSTKQSKLSTKQIMILLLLHGRLQKTLPTANIDFSNGYWPLLLAVAQQDLRFGNLVLVSFQNTYQLHPVFFVCACKYLLGVFSSRYLQHLQTSGNFNNKKSTVEILNRVLTCSVRGHKSYHGIWMVELFINILTNQNISKQSAGSFYRQIRSLVYHNDVLHDRIRELMGAIDQGNAIGEIWICKHNANRKSRLSLAEKIELTAYLRLLTVIAFHDLSKQPQTKGVHRDQDQSKIQQKISQSMISCLPFLTVQLFNCKNIDSSSQLQSQLRQFQLQTLLTSAIQSSGLRQYRRQQIQDLSSRWKINNGLQLLSELVSIQLQSLVCIWLSPLVSTKSSFFGQFIAETGTCDVKFSCLVDFYQRIIDRYAIYKECEGKLQPIISSFFDDIYQKSIKIAEETMFTNNPSLTSTLSSPFQDLKQKFQQSLKYLTKICMNLLKHYETSTNRSYQRFRKTLRPVYTKFKALDVPGGGVLGGEDSFITDHSRSANMSRTIRTHM